MDFAEQSCKLPTLTSEEALPPRSPWCFCTGYLGTSRPPWRGKAQLLWGAGPSQSMAAGEFEGGKPLNGLLNALAQETFHGHPGITEELLRSQLYPEVLPEEFRPFLAKMRGILKSIASADMDFNQLEAYLTAQTKKQGGITSDQAAVISKFWKSHKTKIRESLMNQSRWNSGLRGLSWRVDGKSQSRHSAQIHMPVAIIELELGKYGQVTSCCDPSTLGD
uniref:COMM domain-containing protein 1 isoform X6 n=1 Tax=Callithrix jacchus TaxID=9483 RepID=UPI0023DD6261|nr:COMM domain-containing protein 1 isoform X6 [Callithrix jacchus]